MSRRYNLTAKFCEKAREPGRYGDGRGGHGLSLLVTRNAGGGIRKYWTQRLRIHGKVRDLGLGPYWALTLAEAREKALANRKVAWNGDDPRASATAIPTFEAAAEKVIALHEPNWRDGAKSAAQWRASLRDYVFPAIGKMPVDKIGPQDVLACILPDWNDKRETMRRVKQRIATIMQWSVAQNYRNDDPVAAIAAALPKNGVKRKNHAALPWQDVGAALAALRESDAWIGTRLAFEFIVLTAARSGEVRGMTWAEVDLEAATWTVPADRMKAGREHRVPLSERTLEVLDQARALGDCGLVFPSSTGRPMSDSTLSKLLRETGVKAVPHGFRSSFRMWASDTGQDRELAEMALAHTVKGVEGAYQRSDILERRRALMAEWAGVVRPESA
ncbi:MAG: tyrosine-type recombinase/integrase [Boseongicola sp. SB0662_bin_57]|nr:tyrosine-type recombinase/integrase [Boseongicola sp. SB0662_bin_57]